MRYYERNTVWGFSSRVSKNLRHIESARANGKDVHVVTQLITSLVGLIVFPYEEIKDGRYAKFDTYKLEELARKGWPKWTFMIGSSENLGQLVEHLRHAVSHRRVLFLSDSRDPREVEIEFRNLTNRQLREDDWGARINAAEFSKFLFLFADLLAKFQHDYS